MPFVFPMLAAPKPKSPKHIEQLEADIKSGLYVAEEKIDGIRLVADVSLEKHDDLFGEGKKITTWSRYGNVHPVPPHIVDVLKQLPEGTYDGELYVPGKRSYGAVELVNGPDLIYVIFDVVRVLDVDLTLCVPFKDRRKALEALFYERADKPVQLAHVVPITSIQQANLLCDEVWTRDGEGIILKRLDAPYLPDKRPRESFIKMKQLRSDVLTVTGFESGKNGPVSRVCLRDGGGNITTVKTLNNVELARCGAAPKEFVGRRLRIEYQERTPDGNYRHPRWDRWENE